KRARNQYNLLYEAAAPVPDKPDYPDAGDLANTPKEFEVISNQLTKEAKTITLPDRTIVLRPKPAGRLRSWPWNEDRRPNPYPLAPGQASYVGDAGESRRVPWERGHFMDWLLGEQVPVLIEPLVKILRPFAYLLHSEAGFWNELYFLLVILWTMVTWAFFGGAITRMAAVQVARNEK